MRARLLTSYLALAAFVLTLLAVPLGVVSARLETGRLRDEVKHDALSFALLAEERLEGEADTDVQALAVAYQERVGARVVVVDAAGQAIADSAPTPGDSASFANRPEIAAALAGQEVAGTRHSATLGGELLYVAVPVATHGRVDGAVRITYPTRLVRERIRRTWLALAGASLIILLLAGIVGLVLAQSFTGPLRDLERTAARVGSGDLTARAPVPRRLPEIRAVALVLNDTVAKLDALLGSQREFVADASHQLRSPLAALRLRLENLERDHGGSPDLAAATAEVRRLGRLTDALLALARGDAVPADRVPYDAGEVVAAAVATWEPYFTEAGVRLAARPASAEVLGRPGDLAQVLDNLLANAADASPPGGTVTVSVEPLDGGGADVVVADEGLGLSAEERERAFDRFWQSPGRQSAGGSGLGLAIVRQLVRAHGGAVGLEPVEPHGLAVRVTLPPRPR
ncbi:MAG TPA: ATP-binding protein [Frankiaceae bacterium]|nr:ATP-binding protein [Frankiaceae bacterium]